MTVQPGIYRINGAEEYVVASEVGGMFLTSELLDSDDIEDLITGGMKLADYALSTERTKAISDFTFVPYEKWAEIAGVEIKEINNAGSA